MGVNNRVAFHYSALFLSSLSRIAKRFIGQPIVKQRQNSISQITTTEKPLTKENLVLNYSKMNYLSSDILRP